MINKFKISSTLQRARQRSMAVMLCMLFVFFGCKSDEPSKKIDEDTFLKNLVSAPADIVSIEDLPIWLKEAIDLYESSGEYRIPNALRIYGGTWNGRPIYYMLQISSCPMCHFFDENGEKIVWKNGEEAENCRSTSKDWILIYQFGPDLFGNITKSGLSDISRLSVVDKFEFPDISHLRNVLK